MPPVGRCARGRSGRSGPSVCREAQRRIERDGPRRTCRPGPQCTCRTARHRYPSSRGIGAGCAALGRICRWRPSGACAHRARHAVCIGLRPACRCRRPVRCSPRQPRLSARGRCSRLPRFPPRHIRCPAGGCLNRRSPRCHERPSRCFGVLAARRANPGASHRYVFAASCRGCCPAGAGKRLRLVCPRRCSPRYRCPLHLHHRSGRRWTPWRQR